MKIVSVFFYSSQPGKEPVRDWLKQLPPEDRLSIGQDVKTVEYGWPLGMPLVRKMEPDLWEVRCHLTEHRIARILFTVTRDHRMVLLHGFIKKSQKTPTRDLELARKRKDKTLRGE